MYYKSNYDSPLGKISLVSDKNSLIGLWTEGQSKCLTKLKGDIVEDNTDKILLQTKNWLDRYFNKEIPNINELPLNPIGNEFRNCVWDILKEIPYGKTTCYGDVANEVKIRLGKKNMSAQAIGNAVSNNPISIIIPCHRVIGKNGSLVGYVGGLDKKIKLLEIEGIKV